MLRIQPLRVQRDEAIYECTATNSLGEINTSAKLSVLEGASRGLGCEGETDVWPAGQPARPVASVGWGVFGGRENGPPGVSKGQQWTGMVAGFLALPRQLCSAEPGPGSGGVWGLM